MGISVSEHGPSQIWFNNWLHHNEWPRQNGPWSFYFIPGCSPQVSGYCGPAKADNLTKPTRIFYLFSIQIYKQLKPFNDELETKDKDIRALKRRIVEQNAKLDQLEQHGRRESLRISGIRKTWKMMTWAQPSWLSVLPFKLITRFKQKTLPYRIELARLPQESLDRFSLNSPPVSQKERL